MAIESVKGADYYNYPLKDMKIVDHPAQVPSKEAPSEIKRDYASQIRNKKHYGKCKRFQRFLYNRETRKACNRTGGHWGAMIFYFAFFLGVLLIFFMCYFYGVNRAMVGADRTKPVMEKFHTSDVPAFTIVPIRVNLLAHPIIWYRFEGKDSEENRRITPYVTAIKDYYKYQAMLCAKQKMSRCTVDPSRFGPCGIGNFGYDSNQPCLILKLNTKSGWRPDAFHAAHKLPKTMPAELARTINLSRETVCVYCEGTTLYDQDHLGDVIYHPEPCFNESFFPLSDSVISVNPTIAIQLEQIEPGYILSLTCRLFGVDADGTGTHEQSVYVYISAR